MYIRETWSVFAAALLACVSYAGGSGVAEQGLVEAIGKRTILEPTSEAGSWLGWGGGLRNDRLAGFDALLNLQNIGLLTKAASKTSILASVQHR
jgi:hypothetical protein